jgi:hypothetical protein
MQERSGNLYENKGSGLRGPERSGNLIEKKDSYEFMAGMSLKIKLIAGPPRREN